MGEKSERRVTLDDKSLRGALDHWGRLADHYVNDSEWNPLAMAEHGRDVEEDPVASAVNLKEIADPPLTGRELRDMWSTMKTKYQTCYSSYSASGHYLHGKGQGDAANDFLTNFTTGDTVMYFAFLLYGQSCPAIASRSNPSSASADIGVLVAQPNATVPPSPTTASPPAGPPLSSDSKRSRRGQGPQEAVGIALAAGLDKIANAMSQSGPDPLISDLGRKSALMDVLSKTAQTLQSLPPSLEHLRPALVAECEELTKKLRQ